MAEEALRRAKAIAAKWNQTGGQGNDDVASAGSALGKRKLESSDSGDRGASGKRPNNFVGNSEKIFVPVNERRDIQWVGPDMWPERLEYSAHSRGKQRLRGQAAW